MLDLRQIRTQTDLVQAALNLRGSGYNLQPILDLDQQQRQLETERSRLQARSNEVGKQVGQLMKGGAQPDSPEVQALKDEGNALKADLSQLEPKEREIKAEIEAILLALPNLPDETTPQGAGEEENVEVRRWGTEKIPTSDRLPHWEIGEKLGILNFERSTRIAQSRFVTLLGAGAALERALISFMLDRHTSHGYTEVQPEIIMDVPSKYIVKIK